MLKTFAHIDHIVQATEDQVENLNHSVRLVSVVPYCGQKVALLLEVSFVIQRLSEGFGEMSNFEGGMYAMQLQNVSHFRDMDVMWGDDAGSNGSRLCNCPVPIP